MAEYLIEVWYVPRLDNRDVDHLAWIASFRAPTSPDVIVVKLSKPSIKPAEPIGEADLMVIDGPDWEQAFDWMNPIRMFLSNQPLSDDDAEVKRITRKAKMYHLIDGVLYRQGANSMTMWCISREEDIQLLQDIHSGACVSYSSWRSIIGKTFMHDFY
jgi:hypothetical protein